MLGLIVRVRVGVNLQIRRPRFEYSFFPAPIKVHFAANYFAFSRARAALL
jgi:hypothetical protein